MFDDRRDAGRRLGIALEPLREARPVVLGLPRGGIVVAAAVAAHLHAPLDVIVVRKLGVPWQPELAMGAIGEDGVLVREPRVLRDAGLSESVLQSAHRRERPALEERARRYRERRSAVPLAGRTAVIVDDGIATGSTARAACQVARARGASRVVMAAPVAPGEVVRALAEVADEVLCLTTPEDFRSVGQAYRDFAQVQDHEVLHLLQQAAG